MRAETKHFMVLALVAPLLNGCNVFWAAEAASKGLILAIDGVSAAAEEADRQESKTDVSGAESENDLKWRGILGNEGGSASE